MPRFDELKVYFELARGFSSLLPERQIEILWSYSHREHWEVKGMNQRERMRELFVTLYTAPGAEPLVTVIQKAIASSVNIATPKLKRKKRKK